MMLKKISLTFFIFYISCNLYASEITDFSYEISKYKDTPYIVLASFSKGGDTYIKFDSKKDLNNLQFSTIPYSNYVINDNLVKFDHKVNKIKVQNINNQVLYIIKYDNNIIPWIQKASHITTKKMGGFFISLGGGLANFKNNVGSGLNINSDLGCNFVMSNHMLFSMISSLYYVPNKKIDNNEKIKTMNLFITPRITYLFSNGFNLFFDSSLVYVKQSSNIDENNKNEIRPALGFGLGYQINNHWGSYFKGTKIFDSKEIDSSSYLSISVSYSF